jgi:hypothetical protein
MKLTDETLNSLYRTQAQKNLPVYPPSDRPNPLFWHSAATEDTDAHYADAEEQEPFLTQDEAELLARSGTLRNRPKRLVDSEGDDAEGRIGNLLGNVILFGIFLAFAVVVAWAFVR